MSRLFRAKAITIFFIPLLYCTLLFCQPENDPNGACLKSSGLNIFIRGVLRECKENPYITATLLWLCYKKGGSFVEMVKEGANTWFIAIPVGALIVHRVARYVLDKLEPVESDFLDIDDKTMHGPHERIDGI